MNSAGLERKVTVADYFLELAAPCKLEPHHAAQVAELMGEEVETKASGKPETTEGGED